MGAILATQEMLKDDPRYSVAGFDLLYPEIIRQASNKANLAKNFYNKALALSPNLKYAPYVSSRNVWIRYANDRC